MLPVPLNRHALATLPAMSHRRGACKVDCTCTHSTFAFVDRFDPAHAAGISENGKARVTTRLCGFVLFAASDAKRHHAFRYLDLKKL